MAVTHETNDAATLGTSATTMYTNASGEESHIKSITLHNSNTTAETVKIFVVPDSGGSVGTAGDNTNKVYEVEVIAKDTVHFEFPGPGIVLKGTNDTVQGLTDTASKVIYWVSVVVVT